MMFWILKPVVEWTPWYDKAFGHVVCAETEARARELAATAAGDEGKEAWLTPTKTTCVLLSPQSEGVIITDFAAA